MNIDPSNLADENDDREPVPYRPANRLYRVIFVAALSFVLLLAGLVLRSTGPGPAVVILPWFVPVISLFTSLILFSVAILAIGRAKVLEDAASFWIGLGTAGFSVPLVFYALTWPGLLPHGGSFLAELPGTPAWFVQIGLTLFSALLLAAVLVRRPSSNELAGWRLAMLTAVWILLLIIMSLGLVLTERHLPGLITATGVFTTPLLVWSVGLTLLLLLGAVFSARRYLNTGDALLGYVAIAQMGFAIGVFATLSGTRRYDLWWYVTRAIPTLGVLTVLFGLFSEYVRLIRREKMRTDQALRAEKGLRESRTKFDAALASMTDAVFISDVQGRLIDFNDAFATFHRFKNKTECSKTFAEHPEFLEARMETGELATVDMWAIPRALRGETATGVEYTLRRKDTGESWVGSYSFAPIRDRDGRIVGSVVVGRDITARKKMEEDLRQSEQLLRSVLNNMVAMIGLVTPAGILIEANRNALEIANLEERDVIGKPFEECYWWVWSSEEQKRLRDAIQRAADGQGSRYDAVIQAGDGQLRNIDFMLSPMLGPDGRVAYLIPSATDITERKKAEQTLRQSESFHRQVLESIPGMVFTTRPDGYCDYQSQQWVDYTGVPLHEHLGDGWNRLLHPEDQPRAFSAWQAAVGGKAPYELEYRVRRKDGVFEWFRVIGRPIRDDEGKIVRWFGVTMNIEDLKQAENALQQLNKTLTQQVTERTATAEARAKQLQSLAVELIEAEERERHRLAGLLHDDLQQMLAAAKMQLQAVPDSISNGSALTVVAQILDESIATSRRLSHELSPPGLHHSGLAGGLKWLADQMAGKFGLQVDLHAHDEQPHFSAPLKVFMFRAAQELLFNVVKHALVKSARVDLFRSNGGLVLAVSDQGKGFDPGILHASNVKAGLGLISIRERTNAIGGSLSVDSAPGQGSRFTLKLPYDHHDIQKPREMAAIEKLARSSDSQAHEPGSTTITKVLFADDHKVMRQGLIRLIAGKPGIQIVGGAANGREAVEQARQLRPDVVVMDISMPEMDGIEATRHIKTEIPGIRIIGLSMHDDDHYAKAMREAGAEAFLSKTASSVELLQAIYRIAGEQPNFNYSIG